MELPVIPSFYHFRDEDFSSFSNEVFQYQLVANKVYEDFVGRFPNTLLEHLAPSGFPFLPIGFFKTHEVYSGLLCSEFFFESSGTSKQVVSKHFIADISIYEAAFSAAFQMLYGLPDQYCILGLLPSYLERTHSSLVHMVKSLMDQSGHLLNGFFLNDYEALYHRLTVLEKSNQQVILFGTTFALLDFAELYSLPLSNTIIIETGGMKGRREELLRVQVHQKLQTAFTAATIHSEYGMTELSSQAYANEKGRYICPPWMKVLVRDEDDPLKVHVKGKGALNIIDLANIHSCSFIATEDVGEVFEDGSFNVLGRIDNSDMRGCSLLTV